MRLALLSAFILIGAFPLCAFGFELRLSVDEVQTVRRLMDGSRPEDFPAQLKQLSPSELRDKLALLVRVAQIKLSMSRWDYLEGLLWKKNVHSAESEEEEEEEDHYHSALSKAEETARRVAVLAFHSALCMLLEHFVGDKASELAKSLRSRLESVQREYASARQLFRKQRRMAGGRRGERLLEVESENVEQWHQLVGGPHSAEQIVHKVNVLGNTRECVAHAKQLYEEVPRHGVPHPRYYDRESYQADELRAINEKVHEIEQTITDVRQLDELVSAAGKLEGLKALVGLSCKGAYYEHKCEEWQLVFRALSGWMDELRRRGKPALESELRAAIEKLARTEERFSGGFTRKYQREGLKTAVEALTREVETLFGGKRLSEMPKADKVKRPNAELYLDDGHNRSKALSTLELVQVFAKFGPPNTFKTDSELVPSVYFENGGHFRN